MKKMLGFAAVLALSASAFGAAIYGPGAGGNIPDNLPNAPILSTIVVTDSFSITDVNVTISGLRHTWAGDVIATLSQSGGPTVTLVNRVGQTTTTSTGDSSNYGNPAATPPAGFDYTFDSDSVNSINTEALLGTTAYNIRAGTYFTSGATQTVANPNGSVNNLALNAFDGLNSAGTWTLSISDSAASDTGAFAGWTLEIVPEPTTLSLLALGALGLIRRR